MLQPLLMSTAFGHFVSSTCARAARDGPVRRLPTFWQVVVPAVAIEELGGVLLRCCRVQGSGVGVTQGAEALQLLAFSAKTGRRQARVGLVTGATSKMATSNAAAVDK